MHFYHYAFQVLTKAPHYQHYVSLSPMDEHLTY